MIEGNPHPMKLRSRTIKSSAQTIVRAPGSAVTGWNRRMREQASTQGPHGTRLGRNIAGLVPASAGVGVLGLLISQGALAATMNLSGANVSIRSNNLAGSGLGAFLNTANTPTGGTPALRIGVTSATMDGLCAWVKQTFPAPIGDVYMVIKAGAKVNKDGVPTANPGPGDLLTANNVYLEASSMSSSSATLAKIDNMMLGIDAPAIQMPSGSSGTPGPGQPMAPTNFASAATSGTLGVQGSGLNPDGTVKPGNVSVPGVTASTLGGELLGQITLPNLRMSMAKTFDPITDCAS